MARYLGYIDRDIFVHYRLPKGSRIEKRGKALWVVKGKKEKFVSTDNTVGTQFKLINKAKSWQHARSKYLSKQYKHV